MFIMCVRERKRERENVFECARAWLSFVRIFESVCVCVCVCMCVAFVYVRVCMLALLPI